MTTLNKKTVLQVLPSLVSGGVETGTLDLARYLVSHNYRSIVISSGGTLAQQLEREGSEHITMPVHSKKPWTIIHNAKRIQALIENRKIDIIHARSRAPAWSCLLASKHTGIPLITTFHGVYGHQNSLKRWYNSSMLRGQHTIAVSEYVAKHIEQIYPANSNRVSLIPRGINLDKFKKMRSSERATELSKQWRIPENKYIIMLPGRLTRLKGHKVLLEALSLLKIKDFHCLFVGDETGKEHYKQDLIDDIKRLNLQAHVQFTGDCHDMPNAYSLADLIISASTKPESFGRTICEAQLMQKLVIATDHGGSQETVAPPLRHLMCPPNNAEELAKAIERAIDIEEDEKLRLGQLAGQYITEHYALNKMCQDTLAVYELEWQINQ